MPSSPRRRRRETSELGGTICSETGPYLLRRSSATALSLRLLGCGTWSVVTPVNGPSNSPRRRDSDRSRSASAVPEPPRRSQVKPPVSPITEWEG